MCLAAGAVKANVIPCLTRSALLETIAATPVPKIGEAWTLALIDLFDGEHNRERGLHLMETINRHPDLRGRVVDVAFSWWAHQEGEGRMLAAGAEAVLDSKQIKGEDAVKARVARWLQSLSRGPLSFGKLARFSHNHAVLDDELAQILARWFPSVHERGVDLQVRLREVMMTLSWLADGFHQTVVYKQLKSDGVSGSIGDIVKQLREDLKKVTDKDDLRMLDDIGVLAPGNETPNLVLLGQYLVSVYGRSQWLWPARPASRPLIGEATFFRAQADYRMLYAAKTEGPPQFNAWISDADLDTFRRFEKYVLAQSNTRKRGIMNTALKDLLAEPEQELTEAQSTAALSHVCTCLKEASGEFRQEHYQAG